MPLRKVLLLAALLFASCSRTEKNVTTTQPSGPSPNPSLSAEDVVKTVVLAMQHNDTPAPDAGIATAFRFASPGNRKMTGPLERFIPMVKTPAYAPLLDFKSVEFLPVEVRGNEARTLVRIHTQTDETVVYYWGLSKQDDGQFANCWMTDQVVPVEPAPHEAPPPPEDKKPKATPI